MAVDAIKAGAMDYIVKSREAFIVMPVVVDRALHEWKLLLERKKAEDALVASETRYRHLFESMLEGFALCRMVYVDSAPRDFIYIQVNEAFETLTGLKKVIGKKVSEVIPGIQTSDPELLRIYGEVALTGKPQRFEMYVTSLEKWFSIAAYSPEQGFFVAMFDNITVRKQAELKLAESEQSYRTLADSGRALIWTAGLDKKCDYFNQPWLAFTGRTLEQELGDGWLEGVHPDELQRCLDVYVGAFDRREQFSMDYRLRRHDGEYRWIQNDGSPRYAATGEFIGYIGHCLDITERRRIERSLAEKEIRLRTLVQTIPDLIWLKDVNGVYLTCNTMFERFFGAREAEIVGKTDYDFIDRALADFFHEHDMKAMAAGKPTSNEEWITFADDGRRALLDTTNTPMHDPEGKLIGVLGIARDITGHRTLEEQLRQAQKMESIGTLAGGIAHDFNNILSAIIGYGHITLMKMPQDDPLRLNVEHMLESADRAAALTQSLLTFSRKQVTERKPVELDTILRKVEKFLVRVIGEDVEIRMLLDEKALTLFADVGQLEQVFMNLATNARDAMPQGGSFTIETAVTELDYGFIATHGYGKPGSYAMISATDTGIGMNEETRKKIFEPFFTTKEVGKGTGLGLAMVYGIIKQHEGFINVYSEQGKGTTFRIYLPLIEAAAADEKITAEAAPPAGGTETVLLAEDDPSLRKLTVYILEQAGYTVITANDGEEAVTKFRENKDRIQLLLFDMIMPKKGGKEAFDEIRTTDPAVPVLFASGYSPDMLRQKSLIENGAAVVFKPLSPQKLLEKVREVLDNKKSR
jgi:PAS domain S-box-containing protein